MGVGNDRFTDIQESIPGITPKVLAKELKELEQHKLLKRTVVGDYPVKILYTLEKYADTLTPIIYSLKDWGANHKKVVFAVYYLLSENSIGSSRDYIIDKLMKAGRPPSHEETFALMRSGSSKKSKNR